MTVLAPWTLLGLALVPAVLLWGLLAPRSRRVVVGSLVLWRRALAGGAAGRPSPRLRLRNPLVWIDAALVLALVVACARPAFRTGRPAGPAATIVLDRTASLLARDGEGRRRADRLREQAAAGPLAALPAGTPVRLIPVPAEGLGRAPLPETVGTLLEPGPWWEPVLAEDDAAAVAAAEAARAPDRPVLLLTDRAPAEPPEPRVRVLAVGAAPRNVGIERVATRVEPGRWQLLVAGRCVGAAGDASVSGEADGRPFGPLPLIEAGQTRGERVLSFDGPPPARLKVSLRGDAEDGFPPDDGAWLTLEREAKVRVAVIGNVGEPVRRALAAIEGVTVLDWPTGVPPAPGQADVVVAQEEPVPPSWNGPAVLIAPPDGTGPLVRREATGPVRWEVASGHPLADALYLGGPRPAAAGGYGVGPGGQVLLGTAASPLMVTWEASGARRLAILFDPAGEGVDWPDREGFPVFWRRAVAWLAPEGARRPVHRTWRPYEPAPVPGGRAGGAVGFASEGERTIGVSFVGTEAGFVSGAARDDMAAAAAAVRDAARQREREAHEELWPLAAVAALGLLLARAWVAR